MSGSSSSDVGEAVGAADQVGALEEAASAPGGRGRGRRHCRRWCDDDVDVGGADALDDLAVEGDVARADTVSGSRTWTCTIVAPARAASMPASAICSGSRAVLGATDGVAGSGECAGDHDGAVHGRSSWVLLSVVRCGAGVGQSGHGVGRGAGRGS